MIDSVECHLPVQLLPPTLKVGIVQLQNSGEDGDVVGGFGTFSVLMRNKVLLIVSSLYLCGAFTSAF